MITWERLYLFCHCSFHFSTAAAAAKLLQSCPTQCDPIDGSPPGSDVPGIFQARTLEWVAISFSNGWKWKAKVNSLSLVWLFATPWTAAYQAPLSMGLSRQAYWSGLPLPFFYWCINVLSLIYNFISHYKDEIVTFSVLKILPFLYFSICVTMSYISDKWICNINTYIS